MEGSLPSTALSLSLMKTALKKPLKTPGLYFANMASRMLIYYGGIMTHAIRILCYISVCEIQSQVAALPAVVSGLGVPLHLALENLRFETPVVLAIPYTDQDLFNAGGTDPLALDVFTLNLDTCLWEKVTGTQIVDSLEKKIRIELEHFSIYQLGLERICPGDLEPDGDVDGKDLADYTDRLINAVNAILPGEFAENFGLTGGCN